MRSASTAASTALRNRAAEPQLASTVRSIGCGQTMNGYGPTLARAMLHIPSGRDAAPWTATTKGRLSVAPIGTEIHPTLTPSRSRNGWSQSPSSGGKPGGFGGGAADSAALTRSGVARS
jgi:hypothetical protein